MVTLCLSLSFFLPHNHNAYYALFSRAFLTLSLFLSISLSHTFSLSLFFSLKSSLNVPKSSVATINHFHRRITSSSLRQAAWQQIN